MDFNKIKYAGSFLKDFKHNMSLPDLTIGELYATLRWNNIKPVEKTKRVSGGKSGLYPWNEVEGLLKNHSALMMSRQRVLDNRKTQETQTKQPDTKQTSFNWGRENPNYYGSKDMEQLSNEYLANDGVWFDDENDDKLYESLFGKQVNRQSLITESRPVNFLTEGDSRLNKVYAIMDDKFNNLNLDAPVSSSEYYLNGKGEKTTWRDYILYSLRHTFGLMSNSDVKYLPFVALIAFSDEVGFEKRNDNGTEVNNLIQVILAIKKDNALFEKLKNTVSTYHQLMTIMAPYLENKKNEELNTINSNAYKNRNGYTLIEVNSYKVANEIGNYSSLQKNGGKLCYTQSESTWDDYTKNGVNKVYCFLKNGWKDIKPIPGENAPYDEYGLSMIFVFIDENGDMVYSNTRWNHENAGNTNVDHSFTKSQLSEIVDMNINIVCKPHTREELQAMGIILFDEVPELLAQGKKPEEIFSDVGDFYEGFACVVLNNKYNFINTNGELLSSNQWFDYVRDFDDNGLAKVFLNGKWNFINTKGEILSPNQWFYFVGEFRDGFAMVELNDKFNFINTNCELLSPNQWFDEVDEFDDGFAIVMLNGKYNLINTNGELLSPNQWFEYCYGFENCFADVMLNDKWYLINTNGELFDKNTMQPIGRLNENKHKKIHLTESQLKHIQYLKESEYHYHVDPQKVLVVKRFLDNTFLRATMPIVGSDGYPKNVKIVGMKGADGNVAKNMTAKQLFYLLQDKFQHIYGDKGKRDSFLKLVMKDWYERKITNDGMLSTNHY